MSLTMYSASVPVFERMLDNMLRWLDKAAAHAAAKKFDPAVYLSARLAADMLPFPRQIQIATDNAKGCVARLAGLEMPKFEDNEATLDELPLRGREPLRFKGEDYLRHFALPNFYFHATTTYALLRHYGVELGKSDYLGPQG
jgi:hypothetical protein